MLHFMQFFPCLSSVRFFIVKLITIECSRTSSASLGPFLTRTTAATVEFFSVGVVAVVVVCLCESTVPYAGRRHRQVLCWLPLPASASGRIRSAAVTRLCLPPLPFLLRSDFRLTRSVSEPVFLNSASGLWLGSVTIVWLGYGSVAWLWFSGVTLVRLHDF
jgi:hypothetical protein